MEMSGKITAVAVYVETVRCLVFMRPAIAHIVNLIVGDQSVSTVLSQMSSDVQLIVNVLNARLVLTGKRIVNFAFVSRAV